MKVAVIGHTGMGGGALTEELLGRGHEVTGIARTADRWRPSRALQRRRRHLGRRETRRAAGRPRRRRLDVLGRPRRRHGRLLPPSRRHPSDHQGVQGSQGPYLVYIGGAASLFVKPGVQMFDDERFPTWYFGTHPPVHLRWLADIIGPPGAFFIAAAERKEQGVIKPGQSDPELEAAVKDWTQVPCWKAAGSPWTCSRDAMTSGGAFCPRRGVTGPARAPAATSWASTS